MKHIRIRHKPKAGDVCPLCGDDLQLKYDFDKGKWYDACGSCSYVYKLK